MQCFVHPERAAVGICRACGKGVCHACCARATGDGLVCSDPCQHKVEVAESLTRRAGVTYGNASRNLWIGPAFFACMGLVFLWFGWHDHFSFGAVIGTLFLVFAVVFGLRNRRWAKLIK